MGWDKLDGDRMGSNGKQDRAGDAIDVFISYSSQNLEVANRVVAELESETQLKCFNFKDKMPVKPGQSWANFLEEKMDEAYLVLGLESPDAVKSEDVQDEWAYARAHKKLQLVAIEPIEKRGMQFQRLQVHDLGPWLSDSNDPAFSDLCAVIKDFVGEKTSDEEEERGEQGKDDTSSEVGADSENEVASNPKGDASPLPSSSGKKADLSPEALQQPIRNAAKRGALVPIPPAELELLISQRDWRVANAEILLSKALAGHDIDQLTRTAESGAADAETLLGLVHMYGLLSPTSEPETAGRWLMRAGNQNHPRAKAELAYLLASNGNAEDLDRIDRLTLEAIEAGNTRAKTLRALVRIQTDVRLPSLDLRKATTLLEQAHTEGDRLATTYLAWGLLNGRGIRRDAPRAYDLMRDAAAAGEPRAMVHFGIMHAFARGTRRDSEKGAHWFGKAARASDSLGEFYFGWVNEHGFGISRNAVEARRWYAKAAERGDMDAQVAISRLLINGQGGVSDPKKASEFLTFAVEEDHPMAAGLLGELHEAGRGVEKDLSRAVELYKLGAEGQDPHSLFNLGKLYEVGRGVERNTDDAVRCFRRAAYNAPSLSFYRKMVARVEHYGQSMRRKR